MNHSSSHRVVLRIVVVFACCYASWIGMLALHELGHIVGAYVSGGRVISISVPPLGFSRTVVNPNPRERFVVWCGPIFGAALPLMGVVTFRAFRRRVPKLLLFFAGFCAIANGAYIGVGWIWRAGDAGDLMRLGAPILLMAGLGIGGVVVGLMCWHFIDFRSLAALRPADPQSHG